MLISLCGFMGCGKTTVGRLVADALGCPFLDLDEEVVRRSGCDIPEIFAQEGEAGFRLREARALADAVKRYGSSTAVLALGGGTLLTPASATLVHGKTLCIYLECARETLLERLQGVSAHRPLLSGDIDALLASRLPLYMQTAHIVLPADGVTPEEIVDEIIISCL